MAEIQAACQTFFGGDGGKCGNLENPGLYCARRVKTLQRQLGQVGPVMLGTVVLLGARHKQPCVSLNKEKKTRLIYLGKKRETAARTLSANYKTLLAIVEEMTLLNMELLKQNAWD